MTRPWRRPHLRRTRRRTARRCPRGTPLLRCEMQNRQNNPMRGRPGRLRKRQVRRPPRLPEGRRSRDIGSSQAQRRHTKNPQNNPRTRVRSRPMPHPWCRPRRCPCPHRAPGRSGTCGRRPPPRPRLSSNARRPSDAAIHQGPSRSSMTRRRTSTGGDAHRHPWRGGCGTPLAALTAPRVHCSDAAATGSDLYASCASRCIRRRTFRERQPGATCSEDFSRFSPR